MRTRCALYARYSSENQRDASITDQLRICTARAERECWDVVGTFADAAISGATMQRPGNRIWWSRISIRSKRCAA